MLLLPSIFFSLTGGVYAHAVSPAYGKAWATASPPWLLFLLLVTLRLDGERGDARDVFGRMRWLGVYFPLWVFLMMLIAAHQALPYVWDVGVFRIPPPLQQEGEVAGGDDGTWKGKVRVWLSSRRLVGKLTETFAAALAARGERKREKKVAVDVAASDDDGNAAAAAELEAGGSGTDEASTAAADNSGSGGGLEGTHQQKGGGEMLRRDPGGEPPASSSSSSSPSPPVQTDGKL